MSSLNLVSWRCLAHDPAFLGLPGANQIADNDQLGRDAYAHLERFLDGQLADRFDERQPCPNRALGIVLARLRIAEIHRHAVAQVFGLGAEFIRTHLAALAATDFFTVEVLTLRGVVTYYVLFFIHLESRRVDAAGITAHPDEPWMEQIARNVTMDGWDILCGCRHLLRINSHRHLAPARPQPKFECPRGTMGSLSQGRVPVEDYSLWRTTPAAPRQSRAMLTAARSSQDFAPSDTVELRV